MKLSLQMILEILTAHDTSGGGSTLQSHDGTPMSLRRHMGPKSWRWRWVSQSTGDTLEHLGAAFSEQNTLNHDHEHPHPHQSWRVICIENRITSDDPPHHRQPIGPCFDRVLLTASQDMLDLASHEHASLSVLCNTQTEKKEHKVEKHTYICRYMYIHVYMYTCILEKKHTG